MQYFQPTLSYQLSLRSLFFSIFEWPLKTVFTVSVTSKVNYGMDRTMWMDNNGLNLFALLFAQSFAVQFCVDQQNFP